MRLTQARYGSTAPALIFLALMVLALVGCRPGAEGIPAAVPNNPANNDADADDATNGGGGGDAAAPQAADQAEDDTRQPAQNPLIRGVEQMLDAAVPEGEEREGLREQLRSADTTLSDIKAENMAALRDLNRQVRVGSRLTANIVLFVARGIGPEDFEPAEKVENPSNLAEANRGLLRRVADGGARFTACQAVGPAEAIHWSVMTGRKPRVVPSTWRLSDDEFTLAEVFWQGGCTTSLMGDCSLAGLIGSSIPNKHGFEEWYGLRSEEAAGTAFPTELWDSGAMLGVLDNADGKQGQYGPDLVGKEVVRYVSRRHSRPFLLYVAWSAPELDDSSKSDSLNRPTVAGRLEADLAMMIDALQKSGASSRTVIAVLGIPDDDEASASSTVPLFIWGPRHVKAGIVVDQTCGVWDLLPTFAAMVDARRRPRQIDGRSLTDILRGQ